MPFPVPVPMLWPCESTSTQDKGEDALFASLPSLLIRLLSPECESSAEGRGAAAPPAMDAVETVEGATSGLGASFSTTSLLHTPEPSDDRRARRECVPRARFERASEPTPIAVIRSTARSSCHTTLKATAERVREYMAIDHWLYLTPTSADWAAGTTVTWAEVWVERETAIVISEGFVGETVPGSRWTTSKGSLHSTDGSAAPASSGI